MPNEEQSFTGMHIFLASASELQRNINLCSEKTVNNLKLF